MGENGKSWGLLIKLSNQTSFNANVKLIGFM